MKQEWGMDLVRSFFAMVDKAIYGFMSTIYQLILELAGATILSVDVIENFYSRIYTLLGIFMFFKVTFSFINYLINPDIFTDKAKGVQNLIRNVIITLIMIIITPFAFDQLYKAQNAIMEDALIPRFILGVEINSDSQYMSGGTEFKMSNSCDYPGLAKTDGDYLSLVTLRPFYQIEENLNIDQDFKELYCSRNKRLTPAKYLKSEIYNDTTGNIYNVDYKYFLSTIVGIVVCLILISFCFDIAVRSIKLAFLQMIAPIPILSYIDPASSKNGMFSKWLKQVGSTWASLFIRLIALFFAVFVISEIDFALTSGSISEEYRFWAMLFILIGALIFAKQLPKLLEELIPGLKLGGLQLNPFKKVADQALGGKALLGAAAGAVGLGVGATSWLGRTAINHLKNGKENKDKNLEKRTMLAAEKYGDDDPRTKKLLDKWEKANTAYGLQQESRKNHTDIKGKLHIDEMALHPVTNTMKSLIGALTSMGDAAKSGYKQGVSVKFNPIQMGIDSAKEQDKREKFNAYERLKDKATDFFGIKNESGTTSIWKKEIEMQTDNLRKIQSTLSSMEHSFSNFQQSLGAEFNQVFKYNTDTKRYVYNEAYSGNLDKSILSQAKQFSDSIAALDKEYSAAKKELSRTEGMRDKIKPPKAK